MAIFWSTIVGSGCICTAIEDKKAAKKEDPLDDNRVKGAIGAALLADILLIIFCFGAAFLICNEAFYITYPRAIAAGLVALGLLDIAIGLFPLIVMERKREEDKKYELEINAAYNGFGVKPQRK